MKHFNYLSITTLVLGGLLQGCGHLNSPTSPLPMTTPVTTTPTPLTAPQFTTAIPVGSDPNQSYPVGIAYDTTQNVLYVADANFNLVYKLSSTGQLLAQWGNQGNVTLDQPQGIILHNGNLYVTDAGNGRVVEYDTNGNVLNTIQPKNGDNDLLTYPTGIFFDNQGDLYVADDSDTIYRFDSNLNYTGAYNGNGTLNFPVNGCEDSNGNIYIANFDSNQILKLLSNGTPSAAWGQQGTAQGQFDGPNDVKMDPHGNFYVVDMFNNRIEAFDDNGNFLIQWGPSTTSGQSLNEPNSIAFDASGHAFVTDSNHGRIVEYTFGH